MLSFFFHLRTDTGLETDHVGLELADVETAYLEACRSIPDLARDFIAAGRDPMDFQFEIANSEGVVLMEVPFRELTRPRTYVPDTAKTASTERDKL